MITAFAAGARANIWRGVALSGFIGFSSSLIREYTGLYKAAKVLATDILTGAKLAPLVLNCMHDEGFSVFINGVLAFKGGEIVYHDQNKNMSDEEMPGTSKKCSG